MASQDERRKPHFILKNRAESEPFAKPPRKIEGKALPDRDRYEHGARLAQQVQSLKPLFHDARAMQEAAGLDQGFGLQIEFESFPDIELAFESLARERAGVELLNVRHEGQRAFATVFVPDGKLVVLERLIESYLDETKDKKAGPSNARLLNAIAEVRMATLTALWTDDLKTLPTSDDEMLWWEVWLPVRGDRAAVAGTFRQLAEGMKFRMAPGELQFPERTVLLVHGTVGRMKRSMMVLNTIAELRRAKETAGFFDELPPGEQPEWLDELLARTTIPAEDSDVPHVCLFDTGVNRGHPLLSPALGADDLHSVEPGWDVNDGHGHGTAMAGLALAGNLTGALSSVGLVDITHRLESVKLLPDDHANGGDPCHHGYLTTEAVARPEVTAPDRRRVFSMSVTARDNRDRGRPSAWSAAIDRLASDAEGQSETPRLFVLSAGNIEDPNAWAEYPASNSTDSIHDPAQAWNALTVGAATELVDIIETDATAYKPIAPAGGLSPFSTTSLPWKEAHWPLKPDVVFEGGNAAVDQLSAVPIPSLSLLTTNANLVDRLFTTANATSAATALASRMAAQLMAEYPNLWPESVRALIVHSARWTEAMRDTFLPAKAKPSKGDFADLIRHCGFGIPDLGRAMWSMDNSLTLVCEDRLYPFQKRPRKDVSLRDMNLHRLPWPLDELEALGETPVEMRVTLSYFIEPNPSARGVASRYRYESHGLRFDVKRAQESEQDFRNRINAAARDEEERTKTDSKDANWLLGTNNRHRGSLHSDVWHGTAADLASRGVIGIYPAVGWWKTRHALERYNQAARYSLIVSIHAPEVDVDLYSTVAAKVAMPLEIQF